MVSLKKQMVMILEKLATYKGAASKAVANNLTTTADGYVLDARQGKALKDSIPTGAAASKAVANNLTTASAGTAVLDAYQGKVLKDSIPTITNKTGTFTAASGFTAGNASVKQYGNVVCVRGYVTKSSAISSANTQIGTISGVSLPAGPIRMSCGVGAAYYNAFTSAFFYIDTSGGVYVHPSVSTAKAAVFCMTYIV